MPSKHAAFVQYVSQDLLGELKPTVRPMFGGHGFYANGKIFGMEADGRFYLKIDETTRKEFEKEGSEPFCYTSKKGKAVTMSYWTMPEDAIENRDKAVAWAKKAIKVATASKKK